MPASVVMLERYERETDTHRTPTTSFGMDSGCFTLIHSCEIICEPDVKHHVLEASVGAPNPKVARRVLRALKWDDGVPGNIRAVVVHHVILLDPPEPVLLGR